jgi:hypothetical protein
MPRPGGQNHTHIHSFQNRSKGLTEEGLARLGYQDTIVFRPGYLAGTNRPEPRLAETIFGYVSGSYALQVACWHVVELNLLQQVYRAAFSCH